MSQRFEFDAQRAYLHTEALCYPRRVGTRQERRAARYIQRAFASLGLEWKRERFLVSHFPTALCSRLAFALAGMLTFTGAMFAVTWPLAAALAWGLAGLLIVAPWRVQFSVGQGWPPCSSSANLLARLPAFLPDSPARVIFMAHYDTKSQLLPTGLRVGLVFAASALCCVLALLGLLAAAGSPEALPSVGPLSFAVVILLAVLVTNFSGNRSPGALDNGSAVGTLLELARSWKPRAEAPIEVIWVASGSEEVDLNGARHFLKLHGEMWQEKPTLLINLESVGAGSRVYLAGQSDALRLAQQVADRLEVPHARLRVVGAGMDHEPFAAQNLPALSILGDVVGTSFALHTTRDNMDLIQCPALERAGRLAAHLAWNWAALNRVAGEVSPLDPVTSAAKCAKENESA